MTDWAFKPQDALKLWTNSCSARQFYMSGLAVVTKASKICCKWKLMSVCFKPSSLWWKKRKLFVYTFNTGTSTQNPLAFRAYKEHFSPVSTNSPQTWKWLFRQAPNDYFSVHVWRHGGNRFSRTSGIYDGRVKRRGRERDGWKESDEWEAVLVITLDLLSLFVCCGRFIQSQVGMRRCVYVCPCAMHACALVFASASGNVLLCV